MSKREYLEGWFVRFPHVSDVVAYKDSTGSSDYWVYLTGDGRWHTDILGQLAFSKAEVLALLEKQRLQQIQNLQEEIDILKHLDVQDLYVPEHPRGWLERVVSKRNQK